MCIHINDLGVGRRKDWNSEVEGIHVVLHLVHSPPCTDVGLTSIFTRLFYLLKSGAYLPSSSHLVPHLCPVKI